MISAQNRRLLLNGNKAFIWLCLTVFIAGCTVRKTASRPSATGPQTDALHKVPAGPAGTSGYTLKKQEIPVISLLLPFKLNSLNVNSRAEIERSYLPLDFYQGFRMALDSLAAQGKPVKLNVFDSQDNPAEVESLIGSGKLNKSSLVIGPVFPDEIKRTADFASRTHTYFVSPLSPHPLSDFNNPWLIMAGSPLDAYAEATAGFINDHYASARVTILRSSDADDKFIRPILEHLKKAPEVIRLAETGKLSMLKSRLEAGVENVLIVPSLDKPFWSSLMVYLGEQFAGQPLVVFAHPSFERLQFTNTDLMQQLGIHFPSDYFLDKNNPNVQKFLREYKSRYSTGPGRYAVIGFDIGTCFGSILSEKGKVDNSLDGAAYQGLHNHFNFTKVPGQGYWNSSIMMLKYSQGQLLEDK